MAEEEKGFTIKDRRIFSENGRSEEEAGPEASKEAPPKDTATAQEAEKGKTAPEEAPLPEVNFPTFVLSLNASALVHLGAIEDPASGQKAKNLPMAKQTIDILSMLEEKTRGNLTQDEENIIRNILYDLRIMYVKESR
jgi:hypothetical protein